MDRLTKDQRRKNMQAVKSVGSKIEIKLAKALWAKGLHYRKNDKSVFGKPDLTFRKYKIAIFVDSEFWHGKDWAIRKLEFKSNKDFWINKIEKNIARDEKVNTKLTLEGWNVVRIWGKDIENNLENSVNLILRKINSCKSDVMNDKNK